MTTRVLQAIAGVGLVSGVGLIMFSQKDRINNYLIEKSYDAKVWEVYTESPLNPKAQKRFNAVAVKINKTVYMLASAGSCVITLNLTGNIYTRTLFLHNKKHGTINSNVEAIIENELCLLSAPFSGIEAFELSDEAMDIGETYTVLTGPAKGTSKIAIAKINTKPASSTPKFFLGAPTEFPEVPLSPVDFFHLSKNMPIIYYTYCLRDGWEIVENYEPEVFLVLGYCALNKSHLSYSRGYLLPDHSGSPVIDRSRDLLGIVYLVSANNTNSVHDYWVVTIPSARIKDLLLK